MAKHVKIFTKLNLERPRSESPAPQQDLIPVEVIEQPAASTSRVGQSDNKSSDEDDADDGGLEANFEGMELFILFSLNVF